jgi:transposase
MTERHAPAPQPLPDDIEALQALVRSQREQIAELEQQLAWFMVHYRLAQQRRFGASSETCPHQLDLFADILEQALAAATQATTASLPGDANAGSDEQADGPGEAPPLQGRRGGRQGLPRELPRETLTHDLPEADKVCPCCGKVRQVIGEERSEQLDIVPAKLKVIEHIRLKYACPACAQSPTTAAKPAQPIAKSNAAPGLLAYLVIAKVADGLPLYRLERSFARLGFRLPRATQAHWLIQAGQLIQPLINLMQDALLERDIILADETPFQVLKEPGRAAQTQSYLWCYRSGCGPPIILFDYSETRAGANAQAYLDGFRGYLLTDGYSGYDGMPLAVMVACWSHARRYFHDIVKVRPSAAAPGLADDALATINALFSLERQWQDCSAAQRLALRQRFSAPIITAFKAWLECYLVHTAPKTLLGKAIRYTLNLWPRLIRFLDDGRLVLSNNETEQAIKAFVIGRKAFLFADSQAGAHALANLYALVETAKANGQEPWAYLQRVFTELPAASDVTQIEALLPWPPSAGDAARG